MALKLLVQQVNNLINDLLKVYPNDKDLIVCKHQYEFMSGAMSEQIFGFMCEYVLTHKKQILEKDEHFFLEKLEIQDKTSEIIKLENKIKTLWKTNMSDQSKIIIWKYFKVFIILTEKILKSKLQ